MLDPKISEAISESALELGQPSGLADKLVRWMDDLARDAETLDDRDAVNRRLDLIYAAAATEHGNAKAE
ncbi:MAG TPA: hypothetical protein VGB53_05815 [Rubricoccaceae bacterium]|jgi:hypothetical protein